MAKLYVFGIGGTGSRVLRSLAMLLASGVKLGGGIDTLVPIIIDPDSANGDMNRTADILAKYQEIKKPFDNDTQGFFAMKVKTLPQLSKTVSGIGIDNFKFEINGTHGQKFKDYIGYNSLSEDNKAFVELLFSDHNLDADMDVGFKGNPNIGSVVLNQFTRSQEYNQFIESFSDGDKIFIISSIFGGTGAAGFPLLLKNLREDIASGGKAYLVKEAVIGAISILPYFKLKATEEEESEIDSSSFLGKAKAALSYYERTIVKDKRLNSFYYIGDKQGGMYDNHDGRDKQKNHAHFVELAASLAIIDFAEESSHLSTTNGTADNPKYKEFGIEKADGKITFHGMGNKSFKKLTKPLAQLTLFSHYLELGLEKAQASTTTWLEEKEQGVPKPFFNEYYYSNYIKRFIEYFDEWRQEMEDNNPSFSPFLSEITYSNALEFVRGYKPKGKLFGLLSSSSIAELDAKANKAYKQYAAQPDEAKFLHTFHSVTDKVLTEKLGL